MSASDASGRGRESLSHGSAGDAARSSPCSPSRSRASRLPTRSTAVCRTSPSGTASAPSCSATATRSSIGEPVDQAADALLPGRGRRRSRPNLPERCVRRRRDRHRRSTAASTSTRCSQRIHPAESRVQPARRADAGQSRRRSTCSRSTTSRSSTRRSPSAAPRWSRRWRRRPRPVHLTRATTRRGRGGGVVRPVRGRRARRRRGQAPRRPVRPERPHDAQGQALAHRRRRGGRLPAAQDLDAGAAAARLDAARPVRRRRQLQHVGVCASFTEARRAELLAELDPLRVDFADHPWGEWQDEAAQAERAAARRPESLDRHQGPLLRPPGARRASPRSATSTWRVDARSATPPSSSAGATTASRSRAATPSSRRSSATTSPTCCS